MDGSRDTEISRSDVGIGLGRHTPARVGLERAGDGIATRHALEFALAHAMARDAVYSALDVGRVVGELGKLGLTSIQVRSKAGSKAEYLRRPDLGRRLSEESETRLAELRSGLAGHSNRAVLSIVVGDGLSAMAVQRHAVGVIEALVPSLDSSWVMLPVVVAERARVALGDRVGLALGADATVMLIGERPGLSSPDSLGAYITWRPGLERTDAERNCVSNIRRAGEGLDAAAAARKIAWYLVEGRKLGLSGVAIRESDELLLPDAEDGRA